MVYTRLLNSNCCRKSDPGEHLGEAEGQPHLPVLGTIVEHPNSVLLVVGEEHIAQPTNELTAKVTEVLVQVDPHSVVEANVVFHKRRIPALGRETTCPVLVVTPDRVEVDPAIVGFHESHPLTLPFGPPDAHRSNADVGAVLLVVVL